MNLPGMDDTPAPRLPELPEPPALPEMELFSEPERPGVTVTVRGSDGVCVEVTVESPGAAPRVLINAAAYAASEATRATPGLDGTPVHPEPVDPQ